MSAITARHGRFSSLAAFTLIELLVVISIIALLIALLLPALKRAKEAAMNAQCMSNERQLIVATTQYINDNDGLFPMGMDRFFTPESIWTLSISPYVAGWDVYKCPVKLHPAPHNTYIANGDNWMFFAGDREGWYRKINDVPRRVGWTDIMEVKSPSQVICFFETIRDWTGIYGETADPEFCDYAHKFEYNPRQGLYRKLTGGRHFRTAGRGDTDPWGLDNVGLVDGHVVTISMQYLVENEPFGVFYSYPFNEESRRPLEKPWSRPPGAEIWMPPWY